MTDQSVRPKRGRQGEKTRDRTKYTVVSLPAMLEKQRRLVNDGIDALQREFNAAPGRDGMLSLTDKDATKLDKLSAAVVKLVDADIRHRKAMKAMGEDLSPDEENAALIELICGFEAPRRVDLLREIARYHRQQVGVSNVATSFAEQVLANE